MADYKEYVHAVYQEKSFSNAAKKLFVSQPWLSATVKKVEQEIGFPIFNRSTNPISLTEEGRYYIRHIEQIMALEKEMAQHFKELRPYAYSFTDFLQREKPQVKRPPVPLRAFQNESFLMLKSGHDIHTRSVTLCRNAGFNPKVSMYLAQMMTAYYLVCEGQGITFLRSTIPEYVTPTDSVVFYQLEDPAALRTIYLSYLSQGTSTLGRKLIDYVWSRNLLGK